MLYQEQTQERELEREEFQRELGKLHTLVKEKEKSENAEHRLQREVGVGSITSSLRKMVRAPSPADTRTCVWPNPSSVWVCSAITNVRHCLQLPNWFYFLNWLGP